MTYVDSHSDLEQNMRLSKILQALSRELTPGPNRLEGAAEGDILVYFQDNTSKLYPRVTGALFVPVAFIERFVEWPPNRGSGGPVDVHLRAPADVEWPIINTSGRKACIRSSNGNKIEKTVYMHALVEAQPVTFAFKSTALDPVKRFSADVDRVRFQIDGEMARVVGATYRLSSEQMRDGTNRWYLPTFERLGLLGESGGPPNELARKAKGMRFELLLEEERQKKERLAAISVVQPTPPLIGVSPPPRGTTTFTTGIRWSDPKAPVEEPSASLTPPAKRPDLNDDIPWQD